MGVPRHTAVLLNEEGNEPVEAFLTVAGGCDRQLTLELVIAEQGGRGWFSAKRLRPLGLFLVSRDGLTDCG